MRENKMDILVHMEDYILNHYKEIKEEFNQ